MRGKGTGQKNDRTYYHDPKEMVNFVQGDENIFQGRGRLPGYFFLGVVLTLFYTVILLFITLMRSRHVLFPGAVDSAAYGGLTIDVLKNTITTIQVKRFGFSLQLLKLFLAKSKKMNWQFFIAGKPVGPGPGKEVLYILNPRFMPGELRPLDLVGFFKRLSLITGAGTGELVEEFGKDRMNRCFSQLDNEFKTLFLVKLALHANPRVLVFWYFIHGNGIPEENRKELSRLLEASLTGDNVVIDIVDLDSEWLYPNDLFVIKEIKGKYVVSRLKKTGA